MLLQPHNLEPQVISSHPVGTPPPFATPTFSTPALTTATDAPPAKTGGSSMRGLASKSFSLVRGGVEALTSTVAEQTLQVLGAPHPAEVNALPPLPTSILDAPSISLCGVSKWNNCTAGGVPREVCGDE